MIEQRPTDKSELIINHDSLDLNENAHVERRVSEKPKGKEKERKYYSNNNSIIELQQVDDNKYVTWKTRVIPNSEWSTPKGSKEDHAGDQKNKENEVIKTLIIL